MKSFLLVFLFLNIVNLYAEEKDKKVIYEYKKYEKFDFDEIGVEGDKGAPGDLSIAPRLQKDFSRQLPERKNFNKEMVKAVDGIR